MEAFLKSRKPIVIERDPNDTSVARIRSDDDVNIRIVASHQRWPGDSESVASHQPQSQQPLVIDTAHFGTGLGGFMTLGELSDAHRLQTQDLRFLNRMKEHYIDTDVSRRINTKANTPHISDFLESRKPTILKEAYVDDSNLVSDPYVTIIAPLNTDLRWGNLPRHNVSPYNFSVQSFQQRFPNRLHQIYDGGYDTGIGPIPTYVTESYDDATAIVGSGRGSEGTLSNAKDDSDTTKKQSQITIPPLNTDIRFVGQLPYHDPAYQTTPQFHIDHPHAPHVHQQYAENFSWHLTTDEDKPVVVAKKKLINPVQNQHMCGSCWAMCAAGTISDCFVVGGTVQWSPRIAPTFIMMCVPRTAGNNQCEGGNPATVVSALEDTPVTDTSCIDYSWCTNDKELCTSASAAQHFQSDFSAKLNANIPDTCGCYFEGEKYMYKIDKGSNVFAISTAVPVDLYRATVKANLVDFGPTMGGYAVQRNFVTGNFTDPAVNEGVYFDRCDYGSHIAPGQKLTFNDSFASEFELNGLHAVSVVGWGLAKNVQYDNDKYGDVPFWWCRNSWGSNWGNMNGYFKIAMYPYNKWAQTDYPISVRGSTIGGMILVRATTPPTTAKLPEIKKMFLDAIKRIQSDSYYKETPEEISKHTNGGGGGIPSSSSLSSSLSTYILIIGAICLIILGVYIFKIIRRHGGIGSKELPYQYKF